MSTSHKCTQPTTQYYSKQHSDCHYLQHTYTHPAHHNCRKKGSFPTCSSPNPLFFGEDSRFARSKTVNGIEVATKLRGIQCIQRYTTVMLVIIPCRVVSCRILLFVLFYSISCFPPSTELFLERKYKNRFPRPQMHICTETTSTKQRCFYSVV